MSVIHSGERERGSGGSMGRSWTKIGENRKLLSIEPTWWCFVSGGVATRLADLDESVSFFKYWLLLFVLWGVA